MINNGGVSTDSEKGPPARPKWY